MATHILENATANANLIETDLTSLGLADFVKDYKSERSKILTTNNYITPVILALFGSAPAAPAAASVAPALDTKEFITVSNNIVTINADKIKAKLSEIKTKSSAENIDTEIKQKIRNNITELRKHIKTLANRAATIKANLVKIYAINSSIKVFTILYMYVVLIEKYVLGPTPGPNPEKIEGCTDIFTNILCEQNLFLKFQNKANLEKAHSLIIKDGSATELTLTDNTYINYVSEFNNQHSALTEAAKSNKISDVNMINAIIRLLREAQYYQALSKLGGDNSVGDDSLLKFVTTILPLAVEFSDQDFKVVG